jgi:hypothetical protein
MHQLHDLIALFGLDGAELILHVDAMLATQGDKILALHVQLTRQGKDANFLFLLQALLLCDLSVPDPCGDLPPLRGPSPRTFLLF